MAKTTKKPDVLSRDPRVKAETRESVVLYSCRKCDKILISAGRYSLFGSGLNQLDIAMIDDHYLESHPG